MRNLVIAITCLLMIACCSASVEGQVGSQNPATPQAHLLSPIPWESGPENGRTPLKSTPTRSIPSPRLVELPALPIPHPAPFSGSLTGWNLTDEWLIPPEEAAIDYAPLGSTSIPKQPSLPREGNTSNTPVDPYRSDSHTENQPTEINNSQLTRPNRSSNTQGLPGNTEALIPLQPPRGPQEVQSLPPLSEPPNNPGQSHYVHTPESLLQIIQGQSTAETTAESIKSPDTLRSLAPLPAEKGNGAEPSPFPNTQLLPSSDPRETEIQTPSTGQAPNSDPDLRKSDSVQGVPTRNRGTPHDLPTAVPQSAIPQSAIPQSVLPDSQGSLPPSNSVEMPQALQRSSNTGDASGAQSSSQYDSQLKYDGKGPIFSLPIDYCYSPRSDSLAHRVSPALTDFSPPPISNCPVNPSAELAVYREKFPVISQRPWVELWRPLYTNGTYAPAKTWFGERNPMLPHFIVYGDWRTAVGSNRNANFARDSWATFLNLDMDLKLTGTERFHAFIGPLDRTGDPTRLDFTGGNIAFVDRTDLRLDSLFFEGDLGALVGGMRGTQMPFDLPFTFGFFPLVYQNGIWAADNVIGAACAIPSKNAPWLKWANYDLTLFAATDQVTTDAFRGDNNAAEFFGTACFIEAYGGYIETEYAFVHDDVGQHRSYHNLAVSFTRRYWMRVSNSVRYILNFGQALPTNQRTADGFLLLLENSLISSNPNTFVPYWNLFYGQGRPQSVARAGGAGGILTNTGINFEFDALTAYPTLDATGHNTFGGALGLNILGANFGHQLVLELSALGVTGSQQFRNAPGDQY
ncbi:MAG: hypothetical protein KDB03_03945, partial [Planctomycetales bacterium]|nr:hypothetical protein [Planctomycetales bacterium]